MRTLLGWTLLVAILCLAGTIAGRARRDPGKPRIRLLNKPKKTRLTVLVPPGPTPRLIPSESPRATRARAAPAPVSRSILPGIPFSGRVDYIAPFSGSSDTKQMRVDYLLESDDSEESADSAGCTQTHSTQS